MERFLGAEDEAFRQALHVWARALWATKAGGGSALPSFEMLEK